MSETRIAEIRSGLQDYAPEADVLYTNQEIIDKLVSLQEAMSRQVFAVSHAEHFAAKEIMVHFKGLADEYGLIENDVYRRFDQNMRRLGHTIGSLKKGAKGERRTRDGLRVMSFDHDVRILYNITLQSDGSKTEYDAIVLTPYGIFVVEAKNFSGAAYLSPKGVLHRESESSEPYNLGERMNNKEFLLRNCLGNFSNLPYHGLLLYVDETASIFDEYKQFPITYCNTVAAAIRSFDTGKVSISSEQIAEIETRLMEHCVENKGICKVECNQIIADFATLMAAIEGKADAANHVDDEENESVTEAHEKKQSGNQEFQKNNGDDILRWVAVGGVSAVVGFFCGYFAKSKLL